MVTAVAARTRVEFLLMDQLPWLVVHGRSVWLAALVGLPLLGAGVWAAVAVASIVARAIRIRRLFGPPLGAGPRDDGALVTLAGRVAGDAEVAVATAAGSSGATYRFAAEALAIDVAGESIPVAGAPPVLLGSSERGPTGRARLPAAVRKAIPPAPGARCVVRWLAGGDAVLVRGVLRRVPVVEVTGGYRHAGATWALAVDAAQEGQGIAKRGAPPLGGPLTRAVLRGAAAGLAMFALMFGMGDIVAVPSTTQFEFATPLGREPALREMSSALASTPHHDPALLEREVALAELRHDPLAKQAVLVRHRQLRRAADPREFGSSVQGALVAVDALAELGEFNAASDLLGSDAVGGHGDEGGVAGAIVHLLAGQPVRAARTLRHTARLTAHERRGWGPMNVPPRSTLLAVADALDAQTSDDPKLDTLRRAVRDPNDPRLSLLLADLLEGDARAEALRVWWQGPPMSAALARFLAREAGQGGREPDELVYPVWLALGREERHLWGFFPALFESDEHLEGQARTDAAFMASALGDHARATRLLPAAEGTFSLDQPREMDALLSQTIAWRANRRESGALPFAASPWLARPLQAWLNREASPYGADLDTVLDRAPSDADQAYVVGHAARLFGPGGEHWDLGAWLRYGAFEHQSRTRLGRAAELENLHLLAIAHRDVSAAEQLGAIVARHREALLRRETLVPLAVLEEIVMMGEASPDISRDGGPEAH
jgi:hypothetical protein